MRTEVLSGDFKYTVVSKKDGVVRARNRVRRIVFFLSSRSDREWGEGGVHVFVVW